MIRPGVFLVFIILISSCSSINKPISRSNELKVESFSNPILDSGADPYTTFYNGNYYYSYSAGGKLHLRKTEHLSQLRQSTTIVIWTPPENTMHSEELWAPEIHRIDNKWYVYYAADDGNNDNHRMYVLENNSENPFEGSWEFKGKLATPSDKWAIDGNVFEENGQLYMIWSGWEGDENGQQNIYIAKMKNPYTMEGERLLISSPTYEWERKWKQKGDPNAPRVYVNEGPQYLRHNSERFIVFSASGCWTDEYKLGLLKWNGGDFLNPTSWEKHPEPIFQQSPENSVYGPGHNSFFKSPDGTEDWLLYHANSNPGEGCGRHRSPRMQKITWRENGLPNLGEPVEEGVQLELPSDTKAE